MLFEWIIFSLAVWRVSSLFVREDGPGDIFAKLRRLVGTEFDQNSREFGTTSLSRGILCLWCVSVWISLPAGAIWEVSHSFSQFPILDFFIVSFGLSASAIFLDKYCDKLG